MKTWIILATLAALLAGCAPSPAPPIVTINARDESGQIIASVNVWDNYQTRATVVGVVHDGDRVALIRRAGDGAQIQTTAGVRGWVSAAFIKQ